MRWRDAMALAGVALLAACAQMPVATNPASELASPRPTLDARGQAIVRHQQRAQQARSAGDLAKAENEWLQVGNTAMKGGDSERATQAMLRVLALDPDNDEAAKALREIDRQRITRIQGDRAQKLRPVDIAGLKSAPSASEQYDLEQPLEMLRAGDVNGGLRELRAYVDANPGNRAARQKIGTAVADRARELQNKGSREQAYMLYEQAVALRGETTPEWNTQMQALRKALSEEYYNNGERAYRSDVALAIKQWETSLRYDPQNLKASMRLRDARLAQEKLQRIAPPK
jgi:tetratricopeptide (TPR) repeat protein